MTRNTVPGVRGSGAMPMGKKNGGSPRAAVQVAPRSRDWNAAPSKATMTVESGRTTIGTKSMFAGSPDSAVQLVPASMLLNTGPFIVVAYTVPALVASVARDQIQAPASEVGATLRPPSVLLSTPADSVPR